MEEVAVVSDQSNKENVPPLSAKSLIPPVAPSFKKKRRRLIKINRIPLADITNLFIQSAPEIPPLSDLPQSNSRLMTHSISDSMRRVRCSKSLRMGFR
ncbi:hypothetical protein QN277_002708 [Acacia crassicarpa]|uniref:Uncharacterized protein n=1 Tax=Acacia crassicarpa TaxID=499986 RepID=A0AAE1TJX9_9FABA|nr:hypothetical protein QN277_002708 [Acacia crassicarpa]